MHTTVGAQCKSTATSLGLNLSGVYAYQEGQVNSPAHMNPKKAVQQAAQRAAASNCLSWETVDQAEKSMSNISGITGH